MRVFFYHLHTMGSLAGSVYVMFSGLNTGAFGQAYLLLALIWATWLLTLPIHRIMARLDQ